MESKLEKKKEEEQARDRVRKDIAGIYERMQAGERQYMIAKEYHVNQSYLSSKILLYCRDSNKPRISRKHNNKLTEKDVKEIREKHETGQVAVKELASHYEVSSNSIRRYLPRKTYKKAKKRKPREISEGEKEDIVSSVIELYEKKEAVSKIKDLVGISAEEVRSILINYMDVQNGKLSQKAMEMLQGLGYEIELIKKVAQSRGIEIEENPSERKQSQDDEQR